jgi:hypothetical protein
MPGGRHRHPLVPPRDHGGLRRTIPCPPPHPRARPRVGPAPAAVRKFFSGPPWLLPASPMRFVSNAAAHRTALGHHAASTVLYINIPSAAARGQGTGAPKTAQERALIRNGRAADAVSCTLVLWRPPYAGVLQNWSFFATLPCTKLYSHEIPTSLWAHRSPGW